MTTLLPAGPDTHEVTNQAPPLVGHDVAADPALLEGLARKGAGGHEADLHRLGRRAGSEQAQRWGDEANRYAPVLRTHDRSGRRVDEVDHPSWHALLDTAVAEGIAGARGPTPGRARTSPGPRRRTRGARSRRATAARSP